jgi:hypothetical protein
MKQGLKIATLLFVACLPLFSNGLFGQGDTTNNVPAGHWRVEVEPTAFVGRGFSILGSRTVTQKGNLSLGIYSFATTLPTSVNSKIFQNVDDTADIRLTFEVAATGRYIFPLPGRASGPYVGLFLGWETFKINRPGRAELITTNMFATPQIGYEFYYFKKMLYVNPCLRTVFEFSKGSNNSARIEEIKDFIFLPSVSLGVRF